MQNEFDCHTVVNIEFSFVVFLGEINNLLASRPALLGCITRRRRADKRYGKPRCQSRPFLFLVLCEWIFLSGTMSFFNTEGSFLAPIKKEWIISLCLYCIISWSFKIP